MGKQKIIIGINSGAEYIILDELGRGGQGRVFSVYGGKYAFKLIGKKSSKKAQLLTRKISYIKTRPLEDLPISKPIEQVEGEALGYIMEIATDMIPMQLLIKPEGDFLEWWNQTGGLKKRLLILRKVANTLKTLHSRGLVYGDFSFSNIFVSEEKDYSEIFFIDTDNITHDSKIGTAVYTPGYAAPEIIQTEDHQASSGYDTYTDIYSFAIIAYQLLTLNHPFIGDYVNDGDPELEEKAYLGEIPWVNHSSDDINNTQSGIPSSLTISKKMMEAFQKTFEPGIIDSRSRVTTGKWMEILSGAIDALIECPNTSCGKDFFFNKELTCPFCEQKSNYVGFADIHPLVKPILEDVKYNYSVGLENVQNIGSIISRKIISPDKYLVFYEDDFLLNASNRELFKIKIKDDSILIKGIGLKKVSIISNKKFKQSVDISSEVKGTFKGDFIIFFDDLKNYQRILKIKKYTT